MDFWGQTIFAFLELNPTSSFSVLLASDDNFILGVTRF